jgi:hypothetical protein
VSGEISLTCDAWQADNTDGYFAVTGHWIEERVPGEWTLEHALLGFAQMNCSHSGALLGQMLYEILNRLQIVHKVSVPALCPYYLIYFSNTGWSCNVRQREEQYHNASRIRNLLPI